MRKTMTVKEWKEVVGSLPDDVKISLEGDLTISRLKRWGDDEFVVCFSEIQCELSPSFKKKHPNVKVAFAELPSEEPVGVVYVPKLT
jgi:hypothetical protein